MELVMSVAKSIRQWIEALPLGEVFTPMQLLPLGTRWSVDQNLSRLARAGIIVRVARGLYVRPKVNRFVGAVLPEPAELVRVIAAAWQQKIQVHGAEAARQLGLSTQVPMQPIFETTGSPRTIKLGQLSIELRHAAPRKFAFVGTVAGLAISAMRYLGRRGTTREVIQTVRARLPIEELRLLESSPHAMPAWMATALLHPNIAAAPHG
jgi:Family of unknown function (DUF6088)